jgi:hypothetical protein
MKRPKIHIVNIHGEDFGVKNVEGVHWNENGNIDMLYVDFMEIYSDFMLMRHDAATDSFMNTHRNLIGKLIID